MYTAVVNLLLSLIISQAQFVELKIVDNKNNPIEGVYLQQDNNFWHSDKNGIVKINESQINQNDSIYLSHLSYKSFSLSFRDLTQLEDHIIKLEADTKELLEVVTTASFNTVKYMEEVIKKIPLNYTDPYQPYLNLNADITFKRTDKKEDLIKYKGVLQLTSNENNYYVGKSPEIEIVSPELINNVFFIKPYQFLSIVLINSHPVIQKYKKYNFDNYEFIEYKNRDAIKIHFTEKNGNLMAKFGHFIVNADPSIWSGSIIIDKETMAILSLSYSVENVKTWMIGTMSGKGVVKTSIGKYVVEVDYIRDIFGKYVFDSGRENIESTNKWKKDSISTSSDVYLKTNRDLINILENKTNIKQIF